MAMHNQLGQSHSSLMLRQSHNKMIRTNESYVNIGEKIEDDLEEEGAFNLFTHHQRRKLK
jgi:hypothetical protein